MGFLDIFKKSAASELTRLPTGSFTVDAKGHVVASTLPQSFPSQCLKEISSQIINSFKGAQAAGIPFAEITVEYGSLKIKAKELRGGAMIFLAPKQLGQK